MGFESYKEWEAAVEKEIAAAYQRDGESLAFDPLNPTLGVAHVTDAHDNDDPEFAAMGEWRARVTLRLLEFLAAEGPRPIKMLKRLMVILRCGAPHLLLRMSQTDVAVLLNETKQAVQTREERVWEHFLKANGARVTGRAGSKSKLARETYSEERKGSQSRIGGKLKVKRITALRKKAPANKKPSHRKPKHHPL